MHRILILLRSALKRFAARRELNHLSRRNLADLGFERCALDWGVNREDR